MVPGFMIFLKLFKTDLGLTHCELSFSLIKGMKAFNSNKILIYTMCTFMEQIFQKKGKCHKINDHYLK